MASSGGLYAWEFEQDGREIQVRVTGQLTFNRSALILDAAAAGHGIAYAMEHAARPLIASAAQPSKAGVAPLPW